METDCPVASIRRYRDPLEMRRAFPGSSVHYEDNGVILLEDSGIAFDAPFIQALTFPPEWKKIGTLDGITNTAIAFQDGKLVRTQSPLCAAMPDDRMLLKIHSELVRLELGFKLLVTQVFPPYCTALWGNCLFRFTRTENEPPHLDSFVGGRPSPEAGKNPRLKFFLNVDAVPRIWNVGPSLPDILKASRRALGARLPSDLNVLCGQLNASGILKEMPVARVEIPPRGIVFANGSTVLHQVVYGHRMVSLEGWVPRSSLQPSSVCEWDNVRRWIEEAGYEASDEMVSSLAAGEVSSYQ